MEVIGDKKHNIGISNMFVGLMFLAFGISVIVSPLVHRIDMVDVWSAAKKKAALAMQEHPSKRMKITDYLSPKEAKAIKDESNEDAFILPAIGVTIALLGLFFFIAGLGGYSFLQVMAFSLFFYVIFKGILKIIR